MRLIELREQLANGKTIYDMKLRVTYYARVSTDKDEQLNSLGNQIFYYEDKIRKIPNWTFVNGYVDEGISGKSAENRANFMRMIKDAGADKFDLIITKEISRFSRSTLDSIKYTQELLRCGVGVFYESDNINTFDLDSELRLTIMASIAQEEVRKLSERLRFGYKRSIEKGRVLGQNNLMGYNKDDGRLQIDEKEAEIVRMIFDLYVDERYGTRAIIRMLNDKGIRHPKTGNPFSAATIIYIITNPKYKGYYCARRTISADFRNNQHIRQEEEDWIVYKDESIPAIVSEEIWDKANEIYKRRSAASKMNAHGASNRYPLSGKIFCGEHDASYNRHVYSSKKRGKQEVWNCRLYRLRGKDVCDSPTIYSSEIYQMLHGIFEQLSSQRNEIIEGLMMLYESAGSKDHTAEISKTEKLIETLQVKKEKILDLLIDGSLSKADWKARNDRLDEEHRALLDTLDRLQREAASTLNRKRDLQKLRKEIEKALSDPDNFVPEMSTSLLDRIIVHKINGDKYHIRLEIHLKLGKSYEAEFKKNECISLKEIGISQAQVSRLEKTALGHMRKHV